PGLVRTPEGQLLPWMGRETAAVGKGKQANGGWNPLPRAHRVPGRCLPAPLPRGWLPALTGSAGLAANKEAMRRIGQGRARVEGAQRSMNCIWITVDSFRQDHLRCYRPQGTSDSTGKSLLPHT